MANHGGFDEFGCAYTINEHGERDYGDSMANTGRAKLVGLTKAHDGYFFFDGKDPYWFRAPFHIKTGSSFWFDHTSVSRDQLRPWQWISPEIIKENRAPNGDILLPRWTLRLQVFVETLIAIGLLPVTQYDRPWGVGKQKRLSFTWQDPDYCDIDANLVCDLEQMRVRRKGGWISRKLYKLFRGTRAVLHYYRAEAGGVVAIGDEYARRIEQW